MPGVGPHPALTAAQARPGRHDDPRLQTQRRYRLVRRDEPGHRRSPDRPGQTSRRRRRAPVLQADRRISPARSGRTCRAGQPLRALGTRDHQVAGPSRPPPLAPAFHPTSSSWTNLIERWFKELTDKRLRRGRFTSVAELTEAITTWAEHWNIDPKPFIWKATAEEIIAKVQRGRETLHQIKSTTDH